MDRPFFASALARLLQNWTYVGLDGTETEAKMMEKLRGNKLAGLALPAVACAIALAASLARPEHARADAAAEAKERAERCATRLSVAMLGASPTPALAANPNPQSAVDAMLEDPVFIERFARFINAELNADPGETVAEDASFTLAKHVLTNKQPWRELFVGKYDVADAVTNDPNGLGYFRSDAWMKRYAGNEEAGYRLNAAYRILQNTTGLVLVATTAVEGVDRTAKGRESAACRGCHYDNWFALDKVARVLSRRKGTGDKTTFTAPTDGPQQLLGGQTIGDDAALVGALVASTNFRVNAVRLAFKYLYGRPEATCEGALFDAAVDAFDASGQMQSALAVIAKDASFCQ